MRNVKFVCVAALSILLPASAFAGSGMPAQGGALQGDTNTSTIVEGKTGSVQPVGSMGQAGQISQAGQTSQTGQSSQPGQTSQAGQVGQGQATQSANQQEQRILQAIHATNMNEIKASLVAFEKLTSPDVRDYARDLLDEHMANEKVLTALAKKYDIELASTEFADVNSDAEAVINRLQNTSDDEFGSVFAEQMRASHQDAYTRIQGMLTGVVIPEIQSFVTQSLNAIRAHAQEASDLAATQQPSAGETEQPTTDQPQPTADQPQPTADQPAAGDTGGAEPVTE